MDPASKERIDTVFDESTAVRELHPSPEETYRVALPIFEGPLDLLLHLIRREQLNIYDIPIAKICKSYVDYLEHVWRPDVNTAGEFLVMASTLAVLKSQVLLPREETEEEDPRTPLVQQLLEYERFKAASERLDERPWLMRDIFPRPAQATLDLIPVESLLEAPIEPVETFHLLLALKAALDRTERPPMQISFETISLKDRVQAIGALLEQQDVIEFRSLLSENADFREVIVSFLSILELARLKCVEILQAETFGTIQVRGVRSVRDINMALLDQF